jgi:microcin C transport system substrate-binding protein
MVVDPRLFTKPTLEPPMGSGPYRIGAFEPGRFVEIDRVKGLVGRKPADQYRPE